MPDTIILAIILFTFISGVVQASTGFGFGIISMALLPVVLPVADVAILVPFVNIPYLIMIVVKKRRHINYDLLAIPTIISVIVTIISFRIMLASDSTVILRMLGGVLLLLSIYFFWFSEKIRIAANRITATVAGLIAGVMNGLFNMPGPPMIMYYIAATKDKDEYIATSQAQFVAIMMARNIYVLLFVGFSPQALSAFPHAVLGAFLGMLLGYYIFDKMNTSIIKKAVYCIMACCGTWFLLGGG